MSILLAGLAFVASFASLWLTSLRRPRVEVEHLASDADLSSGDMRAETPTHHRLTLVAFAYNAGSSATVVRNFTVEGFHENNSGAPLFGGLEPPTTPANLELPHVLERDDATPVRFHIAVALANEPPIAHKLDFAHRLAALRSVSVTLQWTYRGRRFPFVWRRVWVTDRERVTIPAGAYRQAVANRWRAGGSGLADIAEGREPA